MAGVFWMSAEHPTGDVALLKIQKPKSASKDIVAVSSSNRAGFGYRRMLIANKLPFGLAIWPGTVIRA
jgi:hypothetical protein